MFSISSSLLINILLAIHVIAHLPLGRLKYLKFSFIASVCYLNICLALQNVAQNILLHFLLMRTESSLAIIRRRVRRRARNVLLMLHLGWRATPEPHYAAFVTSSVLTATKQRQQGLRNACVVSSDYAGLLAPLSQRVVWLFGYNN